MQLSGDFSETEAEDTIGPLNPATPSAHAFLYNGEIRNRTDSDNVDVLDRFLVTQTINSAVAKNITATTQQLEVLQDGSIRVIDAKNASHKQEMIYDALNVIDKAQTFEPFVLIYHRDKNGNIVKKKRKARKFQFSSVVEKKNFVNLIETITFDKKGLMTPKHKNVDSRTFNSPIIGHYGMAGKSSHAHKRTYTMEKFIKIENEMDAVVLKDCIVRRNGSVNEYFGKLIGLTNYRMVVKETFNEEHASAKGIMNQGLKNQRLAIKEFDPIIPALEIFHMMVYEVNADNDNKQVTVTTKDFRTLVIDFSQVREPSLREQYVKMLKQNFLTRDDRDLFAFKAYRDVTKRLYKQSGKRQRNHGTTVETPRNLDLIARNNVETSLIFNELKHTRFDMNHKLKLMKNEYIRLAKGYNLETAHNNPKSKCPYRLTNANDQYLLCSTYPRLLMVPRECSDELLLLASKHRSRNRLPCITWVNPSTNVTIARCAQPTSGITNKKSEYDEKLIGLLSNLNPHSQSYVICDCRPRINAMVNALKGKGYEETSKSYNNAHIIFFDIQNIHSMRSSIMNMKKCCESQESDDWLNNLSQTKWFQHMSKILQCAARVASMITRDKFSVLVHCSDGWDRTAQICSTTELLLDPYYRKFKGFQILVQKEWLWFGHKFADRNGNFSSVLAKKNKTDDAGNTVKVKYDGMTKMGERSPIFIQFLDAVYQIMIQFPWAFEFKHTMLFEYATHCSSGRFGDFFGNCEKERDEQQFWLRTPSFFKYIDKLWESDKKNGKYMFRNDNYTPTATVLIPKFYVKNIVLWKELYLRFTSHDKDTRKDVNFNYNMNYHEKSALMDSSVSNINFDKNAVMNSRSQKGNIGSASPHARAQTEFKFDSNSFTSQNQILMSNDAIAELGLQPRKRPKGGGKNNSASAGGGIGISINIDPTRSGTNSGYNSGTTTPYGGGGGYFEDDYVPTAGEQRLKFQDKIQELETLLAEYQKNDPTPSATPRHNFGKAPKRYWE